MPVRECLALGEEALELRLVETHPAGSILLSAHARDDVLRDGFDVRRLDHVRGHDAVAIVTRLGEHLGGLHRVGDGDRVRLLAQPREHVLRRGEQARTLGTSLRDVRQRHSVFPGDERVGILEHDAEPAHGSEDLRRPNVRIAVTVEQLERALVELQSLHRTRQRHPELLIELGEVKDVGAGIEAHLIDTTGPIEAPCVRGRSLGCNRHGSLEPEAVALGRGRESGTEPGSQGAKRFVMGRGAVKAEDRSIRLKSGSGPLDGGFETSVRRPSPVPPIVRHVPSHRPPELVPRVRALVPTADPPPATSSARAAARHPCEPRRGEAAGHRVGSSSNPFLTSRSVVPVAAPSLRKRRAAG
jgi:hypothetical protein